MSKVVFRPCASAEEILAALSLVKSIFLDPKASATSLNEKDFQWLDYPGFNPNHVLGMYRDNKLCGCIRFQKREMLLERKMVRAVNLTSICIAEEARGEGHSVDLMEASFLHAKKVLNADCVFLFARRAVDHFYTRFGFVGISSYDKIAFSLSGIKSPEMKWEDTSKNDLVQVQSLHRKFYKNLEGFMEREIEFWDFSLGRSIRNSALKLKSLIMNDGTIGGYLMIADSKIQEIGICEGRVKEALSQAIQQGLLPSELILNCSPNHGNAVELFNDDGLDITFSTRKCSYGGHMLKSLIENQSQFDFPKISFNFNFLDQL